MRGKVGLNLYCNVVSQMCRKYMCIFWPTNAIALGFILFPCLVGIMLFIFWLVGCLQFWLVVVWWRKPLMPRLHLLLVWVLTSLLLLWGENYNRTLENYNRTTIGHSYRKVGLDSLTFEHHAAWFMLHFLWTTFANCSQFICFLIWLYID